MRRNKNTLIQKLITAMVVEMFKLLYELVWRLVNKIINFVNIFDNTYPLNYLSKLKKERLSRKIVDCTISQMHIVFRVFLLEVCARCYSGNIFPVSKKISYPSIGWKTKIHKIRALP